MRNRKYRVYDKTECKWLLGYDYKNLGGFSLFGETVLFGEWANVYETHLFENNGKKLEDLDVMDYSNRVDRNGNEIYEKDIVLQRTNNGYKPYLVEFDFGCFYAGFHNGSSTSKKPMLLQKDCVKVGNYYDNPELRSELNYNET